MVQNKKEDYIYHYTSIEAFQNIMKKYRESKDKKNIIFWASNILIMNDLTEMMIGYKSLMNYLPSIEADVSMDKRLSSLSRNYHINGWSDRKTQDFFNSNSFIKELSPFVLSFSSQASSIPMWCIYGKNGHGVCLYFDKKILMNALNAISLGNDILLPIDYEYDIKKNIYFNTFSKIIKDVYDEYLEEIKNKTSDDGFFLEKILAVRKICTLLSPYFKNNLFNFENEVRFIKHTVEKSEIKFRYSEKRTLIPYVEIPIPVKSLCGVEVGPCSNLLLQRKNIDADLVATFPDYKIDIIETNVPLRDI